MAFAAYLVWLFLVLGEGVSYYLQAATFNARFFANLNLANLQSGLRAFPAVIGGGLVVFALMVAVCLTLFARVRQPLTVAGAAANQRGPAIIAVVILKEALRPARVVAAGMIVIGLVLLRLA